MVKSKEIIFFAKKGKKRRKKWTLAMCPAESQFLQRI